ncbi:hypothetical protein pb186bvf_015515 [Paramecium bursaria]
MLNYLMKAQIGQKQSRKVIPLHKRVRYLNGDKRLASNMGIQDSSSQIYSTQDQQNPALKYQLRGDKNIPHFKRENNGQLFLILFIVKFLKLILKFKRFTHHYNKSSLKLLNQFHNGLGLQLFQTMSYSSKESKYDFISFPKEQTQTLLSKQISYYNHQKKGIMQEKRISQSKEKPRYLD